MVGLVLSSAIAAAHVAPSVDDNNRYVTITPAGDRVRIAYVVFFGDVPGAIERRVMDANRDGAITDAEGHAYATAFGAQLAAALTGELDGAVSPFIWSSIEVGMGSPEVAAGTFSIDLVSYACVSSRGAHHFAFHDRFRLPHPGETEVKVEAAQGVTIERAKIGAVDDPNHDFRFAGAGGPIADPGLDLAFTTTTDPGDCAASPAGHGLIYALVGGAVLALAGGAYLVRRTR